VQEKKWENGSSFIYTINNPKIFRQNFLFSQKNIFFAITKGKNEYKTE
jgi:hypothetical protein